MESHEPKKNKPIQLLASQAWMEFASLLNKHAADYLIVGGVAMGLHAKPQYTGDIDLFVRRQPENGRRVCRAIEEFGFASLGLTPEDFLVPDGIVQMGYPSPSRKLGQIASSTIRMAFDFASSD